MEIVKFISFVLLMVVELVKGKAFVLSGLKVDGKYKSARDAIRDKSHEPIIAVDRKGRKIVYVHGNPDGSVRIGKENRPVENLLNYIPESGIWMLLSCFNGARSDVSSQKIKIYRDRRTATRYPIYILWLGPNTMVVSSSQTIYDLGL